MSKSSMGMIALVAQSKRETAKQKQYDQDWNDMHVLGGEVCGQDEISSKAQYILLKGVGCVTWSNATKVLFCSFVVQWVY